MELEKVVQLYVLTEKEVVTLHDYPTIGAWEDHVLSSSKYGPFPNKNVAEAKRDELIEERLSQGTQVKRFGLHSFVIDLQRRHENCLTSEGGSYSIDYSFSNIHIPEGELGIEEDGTMYRIKKEKIK